MSNSETVRALANSRPPFVVPQFTVKDYTSFFLAGTRRIILTGAMNVLNGIQARYAARKAVCLLRVSACAHARLLICRVTHGGMTRTCTPCLEVSKKAEFQRVTDSY